MTSLQRKKKTSPILGCFSILRFGSKQIGSNRITRCYFRAHTNTNRNTVELRLCGSIGIGARSEWKKGHFFKKYNTK